MKKSVSRIVALLLIPALITNPSLAIVFPDIHTSHNQTIFQIEAIPAPSREFPVSGSFTAMASIQQDRLLSPESKTPASARRQFLKWLGVGAAAVVVEPAFHRLFAAKGSVIVPLSDAEIQNPEAVRSRLLVAIEANGNFDAEIEHMELAPVLGYTRDDLRQTVKDFKALIKDSTTVIKPLPGNFQDSVALYISGTEKVIQYNPSLINAILINHPSMIFHEIIHLLQSRQTFEERIPKLEQAILAEIWNGLSPEYKAELENNHGKLWVDKLEDLPRWQDLLKSNPKLRGMIAERLRGDWLSETQAFYGEMAFLEARAHLDGKTLTQYLADETRDAPTLQDLERLLAAGYTPGRLEAPFLYNTLIHTQLFIHAYTYFIALARSAAAASDPDFSNFNVSSFNRMANDYDFMTKILKWGSADILHLPQDVKSSELAVFLNVGVASEYLRKAYRKYYLSGPNEGLRMDEVSSELVNLLGQQAADRFILLWANVRTTFLDSAPLSEQTNVTMNASAVEILDVLEDVLHTKSASRLLLRSAADDMLNAVAAMGFLESVLSPATRVRLRKDMDERNAQLYEVPLYSGEARHIPLYQSRQWERTLVKELDLTIDFSSKKVEDYEDRRIPHDHHRWVDATGALILCRIGPLFFIEESAYTRVSYALRKELGPNVILVRDLRNSRLSTQRGFFDYTCGAIITMLDTHLEDMRIIDAGAGDGLLSMVALKLGASTAELIDHVPEELDKAVSDLELNGCTLGKDFFRIDADVHDKALIKNKLQKTNRETAILSDIGSWPLLYEVTNKEVIQLTNEVPNVTLFLAAGYQLVGGTEHVSFLDDRRLLRRYGFTLDVVRTNLGNAALFKTAFVAVREKGHTPLVLKGPKGGVPFPTHTEASLDRALTGDNSAVYWLQAFHRDHPGPNGAFWMQIRDLGYNAPAIAKLLLIPNPPLLQESAQKLLAAIRQGPMKKGHVKLMLQDSMEQIQTVLEESRIPEALAKRMAIQMIWKVEPAEWGGPALWRALAVIIAGEIEQIKSVLHLSEGQIIAVIPKLSVPQVSELFEELRKSDPEIVRMIAARAFETSDPMAHAKVFQRNYHAILAYLEKVDAPIARTIASHAYFALEPFKKADELLANYQMVLHYLKIKVDNRLSRTIASHTFYKHRFLEEADKELDNYDVVLKHVETSVDAEVARSIASRALVAAEPLKMADTYLKNYDDIVAYVKKTDHASIARTIADSTFASPKPLKQAETYLKNYVAILAHVSLTADSEIARTVALYAYAASEPLKKATEFLKSIHYEAPRAPMTAAPDEMLSLGGEIYKRLRHMGNTYEIEDSKGQHWFARFGADNVALGKRLQAKMAKNQFLQEHLPRIIVGDAYVLTEAIAGKNLRDILPGLDDQAIRSIGRQAFQLFEELGKPDGVERGLFFYDVIKKSQYIVRSTSDGPVLYFVDIGTEGHQETRNPIDIDPSYILLHDLYMKTGAYSSRHWFDVFDEVAHKVGMRAQKPDTTPDEAEVFTFFGLPHYHQDVAPFDDQALRKIDGRLSELGSGETLLVEVNGEIWKLAKDDDRRENLKLMSGQGNYGVSFTYDPHTQAITKVLLVTLAAETQPQKRSLAPEMARRAAKRIRTLLHAGEIQPAFEFISKALGLFPENPILLSALAHYYIFMRDPQRALEPALKAVDIDPQLSSAHLMLANAYSQLGQFEQAIRHGEIQAELEPKNEKSREELSKYYAQAGEKLYHENRVEEAQQRFEKALACNPLNPLSYEYVGKTYRLTGQWRKAAQLYEKLIALDSHKPQSYIWLIDAHRHLRHRDRIYALRRFAVTRWPRNLFLRITLAKALLDFRDVAGALVEAQSAVEIDPASSRAQSMLAIAYRRSGDLKNTRKHILESLRLDPSNRVAQDIWANTAEDIAEIPSAQEQQHATVWNVDDWAGDIYLDVDRKDPTLGPSEEVILDEAPQIHLSQTLLTLFKEQNQEHTLAQAFLDASREFSPAVYTFHKLIDDLWGYAYAASTLSFIALQENFAANRFAVFRKFCEFLMADVYLVFEFSGENHLLVKMGAKTFGLDLGSSSMRFVAKDSVNPKDLLQALQHQLFPGLDAQLSGEIAQASRLQRAA